MWIFTKKKGPIENQKVKMKLDFKNIQKSVNIYQKKGTIHKSKGPLDANIVFYNLQSNFMKLLIKIPQIYIEIKLYG